MAPAPRADRLAPRASRALSVLALTVGLLGACSGGGDGAEASPSDSRTSTAEPSRFVLEPEDVGASRAVAIRPRYYRTAIQCGPEDGVLLNGARAGSIVEYDTEPGTVVLGSWLAAGYNERALQSLKERLATDFCADEPLGEAAQWRWGVERWEIATSSPTVAFLATVRSAPDGQDAPALDEPAGEATDVFSARAYGMVGDRMVAAWIDESEEPIEPERLARLWDELAAHVADEVEHGPSTES